MLRLRHLDTVPRLLLGIRPSTTRGQEDQQTGGVQEYIRHDSQQRHIRQRLHHTLPEQVRSAGAEGGQPGDGHTLVLPAVHRQLALDARRTKVHPVDVHGREEEPKETAVSSFHDGRRHREYQGGV